MKPSPVDLWLTDEPGGDVVVELVFEDRRCGFFLDRSVALYRLGWFIASKPPHKRDGSGWIDEKMTTADVVARSLS